MTKEQSSTISFLTLGDGDFTYSLDLAQHLSAHDKDDIRTRTTRRLIATSLDTHDELVAKYKDINFVFKSLENFKSDSLLISKHHGVNAIVFPSQQEETIHNFRADHVMFHHPHVGTEDSQRHARFLMHLFHSVGKYWSTPNGVFHLTLIFGQYKRWECERAATRHGFTLLTRKRFQPPPTSATKHYQYRRHQTGKSFESRRAYSETFTFGRKMEANHYIATCLPWQTKSIDDSSPNAKDEEETVSQLQCLHCNKAFREGRSLKCHIRDVHSSNKNKKVKLCCKECERIFTSQDALQDHIRAKHSGLYEKIVPDWNRKASSDVNPKETTGSCTICGLVFREMSHQRTHVNEFIPSLQKSVFFCQFCQRSFREIRAKQQHENFCSKRP